MLKNAVRVESLAQMIAVLRAAPAPAPARCISAPDAARSAGMGYLLAMAHQAAQAAPESPHEFWLDCGDDPALAIAALRAGAKHIACDLPKEEMQKLRDIAQPYDAAIDLLR